MNDSIRIGNCSGYYGDRITAMRDMLEGGPLDYLTGDYLAELTMLILGRDRQKDPQLGYAKTFLRQIRECMSIASQQGVRIVTNAGGVNPAGLAAQLHSIAGEQGLDVRVAYIDGDDLSARADEFGFGSVLTANAYLGAFGIAEALRSGADIVVTGRVTDASLAVGPAIAEFGWDRTDIDALAGAVVAGHIIECGAQATGGNFSGFGDIDTSRPLGFPIAEVHGDGSSVITTHPGTGGTASVDTVTAQLVYEIQDQTYLNPDVAVHLESIGLHQEGPGRVRIAGVRGSPPPDDVKVCLNTIGGYRNSVEFVLTGLDIEEKAAWVRRQLEESLTARAAASGSDIPEMTWVLQRTDSPDPATQLAATSILRCHAMGPTPESVGRAFSGAAVELALASYPGFTMTAPPGSGGPFGIYRPAYVPQNAVPHRVVLDGAAPANGTVIDIAPPDVTGAVARHVRDKMPETVPAGPTVREPLGALVHARSGDKGGDANLGVWIGADHPDRQHAYAWLATYLTEERVNDLLPETQGLDIRVHRLPNLAAVNIQIAGLLGEGVAASTRFDPQAKALGEWLRARYADIPGELLSANARSRA